MFSNRAHACAVLVVAVGLTLLLPLQHAASVRRTKELVLRSSDSMRSIDGSSSNDATSPASASASDEDSAASDSDDGASPQGARTNQARPVIVDTGMTPEQPATLFDPTLGPSLNIEPSRGPAGPGAVEPRPVPGPNQPVPVSASPVTGQPARRRGGDSAPPPSERQNNKDGGGDIQWDPSTLRKLNPDTPGFDWEKDGPGRRRRAD